MCFSLTIEGVSAVVHFEARLKEVTTIVQAVLTSLNLNPILLALTQGLIGSLDSLATLLAGGTKPILSSTGVGGL
jgi:hypothetical protein